MELETSDKVVANESEFASEKTNRRDTGVSIDPSSLLSSLNCGTDMSEQDANLQTSVLFMLTKTKQSSSYTNQPVLL